MSDATARLLATASLAIHAPELADVPVRDLGRGTDNAAFAARDLVLRVATEQA